MVKVVNASDMSPVDIVEYIDAYGILVLDGGRLEVREVLEKADKYAASLDEAKGIYKLTFNHHKTELGYPHNPNLFTVEHAKNLAVAAYNRSDLKKLHCKYELPEKTITTEQQGSLRTLVTQIADLEQVEYVGTKQPVWEIWDQLSDYCGAVKIEDSARYKNIAVKDFEKGQSFLLTWLVQLLNNKISLSEQD
ncbi:hypothetical protein [Aliiglaciecola aliphaticivorans]